MIIQTWGILGRSFHFGVHGMGQEKTSTTFSSDSLFAAMASMLARSEGSAAVEQFCRPFVEGSPPFVFTSTFPLAGGIRFFPPPLTARIPSAKPGAAKSVKHVQFVSEALYKRLLDGEMLASITGTFSLQAGKLVLSREEAKTLPLHLQKENAPCWEEEQRPRVTLDRASQASTLFFTGQVTFSADCGLWFGVRWFSDDPACKKQFNSLLADLSISGLGAERSCGLGAVSISQLSDCSLPDPLERWTTLSRYSPREEEITSLSHPSATYTLKRVGGWASSPGNAGQRRKTISLLQEGSVLGSIASPVPGQMLDVRPVYGSAPDPFGHPVYRCGLALAVGLKGSAA